MTLTCLKEHHTGEAVAVIGHRAKDHSLVLPVGFLLLIFSELPYCYSLICTVSV